MNIEKKEDNGIITLSLDGRLDTVSSPKFQEVLMPTIDQAEISTTNEVTKEIKIDFEKVVYVSSAGLRVLLIGQKTANAKKISMKIYNVSNEIMEVFEMTGFMSILKIVSSN